MSILLLLALPVAISWLCGYWIGRMGESDRRDIERVDAKWRAYDTADRADTDEAWDVFHAAFPRSLK